MYSWRVPPSRFIRLTEEEDARPRKIELIGTLRSEGGVERLEYRVLEGSCDSGEVLGYLDVLAERASPAKPCVVVLDNTPPLHTAGVVRERQTAWEGRGLRL
jgi:hypothetical protein